ncbi:hypothetical protein NIES3974_18450 [Calothrix sp. NIES-3974]|nr:hypothetical protein NIES3974_18450 [Calothrix sp. NIES-3974]
MISSDSLSKWVEKFLTLSATNEEKWNLDRAFPQDSDRKIFNFIYFSLHRLVYLCLPTYFQVMVRNTCKKCSPLPISFALPVTPDPVIFKFFCLRSSGGIILYDIRDLSRCQLSVLKV